MLLVTVFLLLSLCPLVSSRASDVSPASSSTSVPGSGGNGLPGDPQPPDASSVLSCPALLDSPRLQYGNVTWCYIQVQHEMAEARAANWTLYDWSVEAMPAAGLSQLSRRTSLGPAQSGTFGVIGGQQMQQENTVVVFSYTAPMKGDAAVLRIQVSQQGDPRVLEEIMGSPVTFVLYAADNEPPPPPPVVPPPAPAAGWWRLDNAVMWVTVGVAGLCLLLLLSLGLLCGWRAFSRKAEELRERREREIQWAHSVPSLKSRIDVPITLRAPLLT